MNNIKTWKEGEFLAQKYLKSIGYEIVETNSKLAGAEVDIVAKISSKLAVKNLKKQVEEGTLQKDAYENLKKNIRDTYVFVEVKARESDEFGLPEEAVTMAKQQHIKRFAISYIKKHNLENYDVQFDVVSVLNGKIEHIENAF